MAYHSVISNRIIILLKAVHGPKIFTDVLFT